MQAENRRDHGMTDLDHDIETLASSDGDIGPDPSLLIVDDDGPFLRRLARAMEARGFLVETADSVAEGVTKSKAHPPKYAVIDLRLGDGNGLDVIEAIRQRRGDTRVIVLTGYGNIATAVTAVKLGAVDYLSSRLTPTMFMQR